MKLVSQESHHHLDSLGLRVLKACKVEEVKRDPLDHQVNQVYRDPMANLVRWESLGPKVMLVYQV